MKIGLIGAAGARGTEIPDELKAIVSPETELQLYPARISIFAYTPVEFAIQQINYLDTGLRAAADGCDALVYNTASDYGIAALRASVGIPVVGAGEAPLRFGASLGSRFSIVTVWPSSTNFMPLGVVREHGFANALASIRNVMDEHVIAGSERPDGFIASMQTGKDSTFDRIVEACNSAVDRDGAEYIILGCTCMSPIAARIAEQCKVPVLNPFATAIKMAESLLQLRVWKPKPGAAIPRPASLEMAAGMVTAAAARATVVEPAVCVA